MGSSEVVDYLIIGAGPAGLQLGFFLDRAGRDYRILEASDRAGSFFERFPRHDKLLSINKVHTGYEDRESQLRYDWNSLLSDDDALAFTNYTDEYFPSGKRYAEYLRDYAKQLGLKVQYETRIERVERNDRIEGGRQSRFRVTDQRGQQIDCAVLVIATGLWEAWEPEIPGIELCENYTDFPIEPEDYAGQKVLILGKGNSAFETANALVGATRVTHLCSPNPVKMAWKSHFFGHLRAVNNDFLDTYILKGQNSVLDATVNAIRKVDGEYIVDITFTHAEGQQARFAYDRVLVCTGFQWDGSIFATDCRPATTPCGRLPAMTSAWESTNVEGMYFAGTLMQMRDRHKTMSNVLHGFRFNIKSLAHILGQRYDDQPWPSTVLPPTSEALAEKIIERVSTNAGLMHQPGFLGDAVVIHPDRVEYFETVSRDYFMDGPFAGCEQALLVTMEYGDTMDDILAVHREPDPDKAYNDFYLHPRVQLFALGKRIAEHHMSESLENEWRLTEHPGERPLILQMGFHGQADASQFQQTHRSKLIEFLNRQIFISHS